MVVWYVNLVVSRPWIDIIQTIREIEVAVIVFAADFGVRCRLVGGLDSVFDEFEGIFCAAELMLLLNVIAIEELVRVHRDDLADGAMHEFPAEQRAEVGFQEDVRQAVLVLVFGE